jgi:type IV pilus assembly protein PilC
MIYNYSALDQTGQKREGTITAVSIENAIASIQRQGLVIASITPQKTGGILGGDIAIFNRISNKDVVILSRQMATLFEAQVSALRIFRLLSGEVENKALQIKLSEVADDIQGGLSISKALSKHKDVFSDFYVNMVKSGEESGKLDEIFNFLADYLDRTYEVASKARNALIYPAFVVFTFFAVMALMLTVVIPKISTIITDSGQAVPIYTQVVLALSKFMTQYIFLFIALLIVGIGAIVYYFRTKTGRIVLDKLKITIPAVKGLFRKLYLSRIADNMNTMLISGIPMVRALELTSGVVDNKIFEEILTRATDAIKGGKALSEGLGEHKEIPGIMIAMIKVGEETGQLGKILATLANFYRREVVNAVDTLVDLIEPLMIVMLGLGVGVLLASVLIPIYNVAQNVG